MWFSMLIPEGEQIWMYRKESKAQSCEKISHYVGLHLAITQLFTEHT